MCCVGRDERRYAVEIGMGGLDDRFVAAVLVRGSSARGVPLSAYGRSFRI